MIGPTLHRLIGAMKRMDKRQELAPADMLFELERADGNPAAIATVRAYRVLESYEALPAEWETRVRIIMELYERISADLKGMYE
ncbi:hypothetical protein HOU02_gp058 [Caulobacter phage CcrBL9]|uniref:Uncharacterized protein n=1 Tax=Caulobacter phage CcrBL9 TaxID=2283270 RepID=A0A385EE04_9CAUD|nr:hypothetical protein HOU02_gp058 [Caulobacter phage CcrBL9]AXQ69082.1 hypothetical protein CcrBL9_gp058c [Caulobacter phage CcrBL9]